VHDLSTTLVAIATPPGRGGVGCVRVSGPRAFEIAATLHVPTRSVATEPSAPRFGRFLDRDRNPVDHGYLVQFPEGRSFTGEPTAELWVHGSPAVLSELVESAVAAGAVPAEPGEFTYRAMRHGRIDLARAEAVRDLVAARTLYQARLAFAQAEGALSRRVVLLKESLLDVIARGEAAVEFDEEADVDVARTDVIRGIEQAKEAASALLAGFRAGRVAREGATVALVGLPNVGKSSLFNRLLDRDRAIVSAAPGTTRDTLEETISLRGIPVRLIDTAGLREIADPVEGEGVRRAREAREQADLVVLIVDGTRFIDDAEREALDRATDTAHTVVVSNKADLPAWRSAAGDKGAIRLSALTGEGCERLLSQLHEMLVGSGSLENPILTDARHARAIQSIVTCLERAQEAATAGLSEEILLEDLHEAMREIGVITGEFDDDELYARIFTTFCIGK
jgi:tRNA modification GTPase